MSVAPHADRQKISRLALIADILPFLIEDEFVDEDKRSGYWWLFSRDHVLTQHRDHSMEAVEWGVTAALQFIAMGLDEIAVEEGVQTWFVSRIRRSQDGFEREMLSKEIQVYVEEERKGRRGLFGLGR